MIRKTVSEIMQSKNAVMFITAFVFMLGTSSYFNNNSILISFLLSILGIFLIAKNYVKIKIVIFWLFIFYIGFFNSYFRIPDSDDLVNYAPANTQVQGQIVSIPDTSSKEKTKFFFKVYKIDGENINGKTIVTINSNKENYKIGNNYKLTGKLRKPFKASNPSQFDYGKYLRDFDTYTVFYADKSEIIQDKLQFKWKFLQTLNGYRDKIINVHGKYLKSPNLEILGGIVFGDDAVSPPEYIKISFVNSGLLHILAASGMNVAFIYGFWFFFMNKLKLPIKFVIISGIGLVIIYTMMTGLGASIIRAALMLLFVLIGKLIDRDAHSVSLLSLVAMIMLIYNPAFINNVGFQLSFIVTFGILTMGNAVFERCKNSKIPNWLSGAVIIPVVAQIWVAPIQMFYFSTFSTYSVFANVLSVPFLSVISFGGFVSSIIALFTPFSDKLCMLFDFILNYVLNILVLISSFISNLPKSLISTTHPSIFQIIIYYSLILLVTFGIKNKFSKKLIYLCTTLGIILLLSTIYIPSKNLEIITFDVQNADCFLIKTPENKYFIIDTGRAGYKQGKAQANSIIIKYLQDRGIRNIEGLIITHFDNDHSGGAVDIMKKLKVKKLYVNSLNDNSKSAKNIYEIKEKLNVKSEIPINNSIIYKENNLKLKTFISKIKKENEQSIITLLSFKDFDILFMGDAGIDAFNTLKKDIPKNIEVLKVGHHGGKDVVSKNMLDYLGTKTSIISTGTNMYSHPNKGTLDTLRNTDIFRTDIHNSIKIETDGINYKLYTYDIEKRKYTCNKTYKTKK